MSAIELTKEEKAEIERQAAQYLCPITQQYIHTAAFFSCGQDHLAEEEAAKRWLEEKSTCPVCNASAVGLIKNAHVQREINNFFSQPRRQFLLVDRYTPTEIPADSKERLVGSGQIALSPALDDPFLPDADPDEQKRILDEIHFTRSIYGPMPLPDGKASAALNHARLRTDNEYEGISRLLRSEDGCLPLDSWEARKARLCSMIQAKRAELFARRPTALTLKYVAFFALYILDNDSLLGTPLGGIPSSPEQIVTRRRELFELLVPPHLISHPFPGGGIRLPAGLEEKFYRGETILSRVIRRRHDPYRFVKAAFLLDRGGDINARAGDCTLLTQAIMLGDDDAVDWLLLQPGLAIEQVDSLGDSALSRSFHPRGLGLAWLLVKKSPIYWRRFLISTAMTLTLLAGGVGALLFFFYPITLAALIVFGFAGLCLLFATYQFFVPPVRRSDRRLDASLPSLEEGLQDSDPDPLLAALLEFSSPVYHIARSEMRLEELEELGAPAPAPRLPSAAL